MNIDLIREPRVDASTRDFSPEHIRAFSLTAFVILAFAFWLGLEAPHGIMWGTDELLTAERSREMLVTAEPWVIHYNFDRSFEKPPLQYWLTSWTLPRFENRSVAVRIWPLVYGVLTAGVLTWLVYLVKPDEPWLIPLSVAILISSPLFSTESARGLLDIGLAFFTLLTIVFAELARTKPVWWLGAAVVSWLGSLQKLPVPFLIWVLIIIVRLTNREERASLQRNIGWLVGSLFVAIALMSIWPLIELIEYEMPAAGVFHQEIVVWLGPDWLGRRPYFEIPISMSVHPGGLCGFLSLVALFVILFSRNGWAGRGVREIALVTVAFLALAIVFNFRHIRYAIPAVPSLCFLLAIVFYRFLKRPAPVRAAAIGALILLFTAGFVHAKVHTNHRRRDVADEKMIAEKLGELQQPGTKIVLIKALIAGNDLLWDSFYLFHGNLRSEVTTFTVDEIRRDPPKPPLIGVCVARDFGVVKELYPNVQVALTRAQFICWQVSAE
jgi:4-amino-4-deoxy-L-arabinose transferase-like glycosyltransferase